jgi:hypothetical protein
MSPFSRLIWWLPISRRCRGEHMSRALTAIGIVALIGAFAWWQTFYGEVQRLLGPTGPLPIECIYSMSSACRMVADAAEVFAANSYHPLIFWAACLCLLAGLVIGSGGRGPKSRSRNQIKPRARSWSRGYRFLGTTKPLATLVGRSPRSRQDFCTKEVRA